MRPLLGLLAALALAGCGDSDSEDDMSPRDEFVSQVDALCKSTNPGLARIQAALVRARDAARAGRLSRPRTFETFERLLREGSATTARFRSRLESIRAPAQERDFQRALVGSLGRGLLNLRRQVRAAEARDARRLRELSIAGSLINEKAKGLIAGHGGFRHCGRS